MSHLLVSTFAALLALGAPRIASAGLGLTRFPSRRRQRKAHPKRKTLARSQKKPWVGILMKNGKGAGVTITAVFPKSPAQLAGLKKGDRVLSVAGKGVSSPTHLARIVALHHVGNTLPIKVVSNGVTRTVKVKLKARPTMEALLKSLLVGKKAPDFLLTLPGRAPKLQLSRLKGNVVLIQFWSLSCGACIASIKTLRRWHKAHSKKGLVIIGAAKDKPSILAQATRRLNIPYLVGHISSKAAGQYNVALLPTFVLVDEKGYVRELVTGYGASMNRLKKKALQLLKKKTKKRSFHGVKSSNRGSL